jgi:MmyB-like transcription regulator ligand binding domain
LDPAARELYGDWDEATDVAVSGLREAAGSDPGDPRLALLIDELSAASERFRELWARTDVGYRAGVIHMRHPKVGDLYLHRNRFNIPHSGGQHMLTYRAETRQPVRQGARGTANAVKQRLTATRHGRSCSCHYQDQWG